MGMKSLIILGLLGFGAWYFLTKTPEGKRVQKQAEKAQEAVQETQSAAVGYTDNLQKSVHKAQDAQKAAEESMKKAAKQLEELK